VEASNELAATSSTLDPLQSPKLNNTLTNVFGTSDVADQSQQQQQLQQAHKQRASGKANSKSLTIFAAPSHILPDITTLFAAFTDTLLQREREIVVENKSAAPMDESTSGKLVCLLCSSRFAFAFAYRRISS
jgi:hypothetical protein